MLVILTIVKYVFVMNQIRSYKEQAELLEESFRSKGFRVGAALTVVGGIATLVGVGDFVANDGYPAEMITGGVVTAMIGIGIAVGSGIRTIHNYDNAKSAQQ